MMIVMLTFCLLLTCIKNYVLRTVSLIPVEKKPTFIFKRSWSKLNFEHVYWKTILNEKKVQAKTSVARHERHHRRRRVIVAGAATLGPALAQVDLGHLRSSELPVPELAENWPVAS
jgi:hypothetical protein